MSEPTDNESKVEQFRDAVADYLMHGTDQIGGQTLAVIFAGVPIFVFKSGDAATKLAEAFGSAAIFGEVRLRTARTKKASCKDVLIDRLDFVVDFYENVALNQTGKGAWWCAEKCLLALNYQTIPPFPKTIAPADGVALEDFTKDPDSGQCAVRAYFTVGLDLPADPPTS